MRNKQQNEPKLSSKPVEVPSNTHFLAEGFKGTDDMLSSKGARFLFLMMLSIMLAVCISAFFIFNPNARQVEKKTPTHFQKAQNIYSDGRISSGLQIQIPQTAAFLIQKNTLAMQNTTEEIGRILKPQKRSLEPRVITKEKPSKAIKEKPEEEGEIYSGVRQDARFARTVAHSYVKEEVDSFVQRVNMVKDVVGYLYGRLTGD